VGAGEGVELVDARVGDARCERSLELPVRVQDLSQPVELPAPERRRQLEGEVLDAVELDQAISGLRPLLGEDPVRLAGPAGEVEVEPRAELAHVVVRERELFDLDLAVPPEAEGAQPAVGRDVLVLLADRLAQALDLDLAGLPGQTLGGDLLALVHVERVQQPDGERARRAEARPLGGDVREQRHLDAVVDAAHAHGLADQLVLDLGDVGDDLLVHGVEVDVVVEPFFDDHVGELVDRGGDDEPLPLCVVGGEIRAAARERDAQGGLGDDHAALSIRAKSSQVTR